MLSYSLIKALSTGSMPDLGHGGAALRVKGFLLALLSLTIKLAQAAPVLLEWAGRTPVDPVIEFGSMLTLSLDVASQRKEEGPMLVCLVAVCFPSG